MPKGESTYAVVEIDFLGDPRFTGWTPGGKIGYLAWWFWAVKCRREWLPPHLARGTHVASTVGVSHHLTTIALGMAATMPGKPVLVKYPSGHVRVCGVRAKHYKLKSWHDTEDVSIAGELGASYGGVAGEIGASERNGTERRGEEQGLPPVSGQNSKSKISDADMEKAFALLPDSKRKRARV